MRVFENPGITGAEVHRQLPGTACGDTFVYRTLGKFDEMGYVRVMQKYNKPISRNQPNSAQAICHAHTITKAGERLLQSHLRDIGRFEL